MIRTEKEYQTSLRKLEQNEEALSKQRKYLETMNLSDDQIALAMSPLLNFYLQLKEEVESYSRIKNRDWDFIYRLADFQHIGHLFIALRIAYGLTQADLAKLLGVTDAQISKDERNEYRGISIEKTRKLMEVFRITLPHLEVNQNLDRNLLMFN